MRNKPELIGRYWLMPDGELIRNICGGKDDDTPADPPAIKPEDFTKLQETATKLQESVAALEAKNRELLQEKSDAKKAAEKAANEAAKKNGDVEALEKSWQEKLTAREQELTGKLAGYEQMVNQMTVGAEATKLAAELALPGSADALLPHIERRLSVEIHDNKPLIRVLGADGKPSAASLDDLRKEIEGNKAFAPLLIGSKGSGGGDVSKGGGAASTVTRKAFDAMNPAQKMETARKASKGELRIVNE